MDDELTMVSAATLGRAIRNKEVSSAELRTWARIAQVNPSLNATVCLAAESAGEAAREADAALARGEIQGRLHGVPMTTTQVAGQAEHCGLPARLLRPFCCWMGRLIKKTDPGFDYSAFQKVPALLKPAKKRGLLKNFGFLPFYFRA